ncbi:hypothetical protein PanWU01x14_154420, partial [Parasponia andersonii]
MKATADTSRRDLSFALGDSVSSDSYPINNTHIPPQLTSELEMVVAPAAVLRVHPHTDSESGATE